MFGDLVRVRRRRDATIRGVNRGRRSAKLFELRNRHTELSNNLEE